MRNLSIYGFAACLLIILIACKKNRGSDDSFTGTCSIPRPADTYDYPIKPGTPQWATFTTHDQMVDACQIQPDTLKKISTEGLIQTCMDFPLLGDLFLNIQVNVPGILQYYMTNFSGLVELTKRADASTKMIQRYINMNPSCIDSFSLYKDKAVFISQFTAYEMIISHDSISSKLTLPQKKALVTEALKKYRYKREHPNNFAYYDFSTSLYIPTRIMLQEKYGPFLQAASADAELKLYIDKLLYPESAAKADRLLSITSKYANDFLN